MKIVSHQNKVSKYFLVCQTHTHTSKLKMCDTKIRKNQRNK